ncbi:bacteriocin immunity protein [Pseudomonas lundensis]|nr:bacteriocin immunity protein [Pseudomonas lundensis]
MCFIEKLGDWCPEILPNQEVFFRISLEEFCEITGHPDGTDLIYYPEADSSGSAEDVTRVVKEWRAAQGLPGFKE